MLNDKVEFPVMRLGNAITPQALKPGSLQFSTTTRGLGMFNFMLSLLFLYEKGVRIGNSHSPAFLVCPHSRNR
jgi:hypothetical protein